MKIEKSKSIIPISFLFILSLIMNCNRFTYKLIYDQLDFILYLQINKYFNPGEKQKEFVKEKLAALLKWDRETRLSQYKDLLIYMKNCAAKGLTEDNINYIYEEFNKEIGIIAEKAAPDAADFLLSLNKNQIENFRKEALIHKKEEQEKDSDIKDPVEHKTRSAIKFLSGFYGSFSEEQTERVKDYIKNKNHPEFDRWEYQDIKQKEFIELVNNKADREAVSGFIIGWMTRDDKSLPEPVKEKYLAQRKANIELYIYVDNNIVTKKQRVNAGNTLDNWITAINDLMSEK